MLKQLLQGNPMLAWSCSVETSLLLFSEKTAEKILDPPQQIRAETIKISLEGFNNAQFLINRASHLAATLNMQWLFSLAARMLRWC